MYIPLGIILLCLEQSQLQYALATKLSENLIEYYRRVPTNSPCIYYESLTISPVVAQCNGACSERSSIECVHIDGFWPQKSWRWRLRSTLNLIVTGFDASITETNLTAQYSFRISGWSHCCSCRAGRSLVTMMRTIYSARLALFIHSNT